MSATPEQIAERLDAWADFEIIEGREDRSDGFEREASIHDQNAFSLNEAAALIRAQSEALAKIEPLARQLNSAAEINTEWGRVVVGQAQAARDLYAIVAALKAAP